MNKQEAKKEAWRIAAVLLERAEPEALAVGVKDDGTYYTRSDAEYKKMQKAWTEVLNEFWRRAGFGSFEGKRDLRRGGE